MELSEEEVELKKKLRNLKKKIKDIEKLEEQKKNGKLTNPEPEQLEKLKKKGTFMQEIKSIEKKLTS